MRNIIKILSKFKLLVFIYLFILLLIQLLWVVNMFFTNKLFESLLFNNNEYLKYLTIFISIICLRILISILNNAIRKSLKLRINNYIRHEAFKNTISNVANLETTDTRVSKIISNVNLVANTRIFNLFEIISNCLSLIFAVGLLMYYHWSYALLAALFAVTLSLLPTLYRNKYRQYQEKITTIENKYMGEIGTLVNQRNSMYLLSKLNIMNNIAANLTLRKNENSYRIYKKMMITYSPNMIFGLISQIFAPVLSAVLSHYGVVSVTLIGISSYIFGTALSTLMVLPELIKSFVSSKNIMDDLMRVNSPQKNHNINQININNLNPIINGKKIFSFPISFNIKNNSKINVIGKNGSGKTTFLNILKGSHPEFEGNYYVNGLLNQKLFGQKDIVFLSEKPFIFNATIKENITLFNKAIKNEDIVKTLDEVNLKINLDEEVNENNLSDGQKQKIAIARAFIYNPRILFLDETLNNIDANSRILIEKKLLKKKMSVVIISHKEVSSEFKKIKIN